jgi:hypothetical protein
MWRAKQLSGICSCVKLSTVNLANENQHYISRVLLKRFRVPNEPLCCYQLATGEWVPKSVDRLCSAEGYNQLLVPGLPTNNIVEASISRVETLLPKTFKALEAAAFQESTELPEKIFKNIRDYCTFLKLSSPFSKASAAVSFLTQLNIELDRGKYALWHELKTPQNVIDGFRKEYFSGGRVIIEGKNVLQLIYRLQFERLLDVNYAEIANADWTIAVSPVDLPMSDIGLVQVQLHSYKAKHYLLPIGPRFLLEGIFYYNLEKNYVRTVIRGIELTQEEAEYRFDCICLSSAREIIFSQKHPNVKSSLDRARRMDLRFAQIANPDMVLAAGAQDADMRYSLKCVSEAEYTKYIHSFVLPAEKE